jgi:uncharacterized protein YyaL (SSP411 family)
MERESFEDLQTASLMNQHFICIKIDREERPDLDHFFMDALQATSGNGGWPLNMFLTSDGRPFYGGTYFPPQNMHNRISWKELLVQLHGAYQKRRADIEEQKRVLNGSRLYGPQECIYIYNITQLYLGYILNEI